MGLSSILIYFGGTEIGFKFIALDGIASVIKLKTRGNLGKTFER
jgi:hypothetical protein